MEEIMKKTKIICTMGPNTNDRNVMKSLVENGMDIARFNFSHGDYEEQLGRINILRSVREEAGLPIAMLLDTKGPEIRTGLLKDGKKVTLISGQTYTLTVNEIIGDETKGYINYSKLPEDVNPGNKILIDDGLIELQVVKVCEKEIECIVLSGGELGEKKGVNVPNVSVKLPALTQKDKEDILFAIEQGMDFIAASFVRNAECVKEIKSILKEHHSNMMVIAKIENAEGVNNLDEIIECSDGIMVARGDLGVEIPAEQLPHLQKMIIKKCNENRKPVITATQMLDSMIRNPRPTRAEVTDVANAIYDGTDAIMLSGETAMGKHPVEALKMMVQIAESTESHLEYDQLSQVSFYQQMKENRDISFSVAYASVSTASSLSAKYIVTPSVTGLTTRLVSKLKPKTDILGVSPNESTLRRMQLYWGVKPIKAAQVECAIDTTEEIMNRAIDLIEEKKLVEANDVVVITAGLPAPSTADWISGITNNMRIIVMGDKVDK